MGIEIERRFLVDGRNEKPWRECEGTIKMHQCYLSGVSHSNSIISWQGISLANEPAELTNISTWRIRQENDSFVLTAKGVRISATGSEFEWKIGNDVGKKIISMKELPSTEKTRYLWRGEDGFLWEVDEFEGGIAGLVIAEIELKSEDQEVMIPSWLGMEITHLRGWSNAALAMMIKDARPC